MNERIYKALGVIGAGNIAIGVTIIVVGVSVGVLSIIAGAKILKEKKNLIF